MPPMSLWKKSFEKNQETDIYLCAHCLIKNLSMRNSCKTQRKRVQCDAFIRILYRGSPPKPYKSLSLLILMPLTHLSNIANVNDFVNKSTILSQDLVCKMLISPCS